VALTPGWPDDPETVDEATHPEVFAHTTVGRWWTTSTRSSAGSMRQERNDAVTEIEEIPNRGHALTIDSGWRDVAEKALAFVKRFVPSRPPTDAQRAG
jgi:hypothetical protein